MAGLTTNNYGLKAPSTGLGSGWANESMWGANGQATPIPPTTVGDVNIAGSVPTNFGMPGYGSSGSFLDSLKSYLPDMGNLFGTLQNGIGTKDAPGPLSFGMNALTGLGSAYLGMKQYGLARDTFENNKRMYEQNYAAQRQTVNTQLQDRQAARVASNPGAYQSVGSYMDQNRIA